MFFKVNINNKRLIVKTQKHNIKQHIAQSIFTIGKPQMRIHMLLSVVVLK